MVNFEFYANDYLGSAIPEKAFSGVAAQAQRWLDKFKRFYRVESTGIDAERMAVCAMAETLWQRRSGVSAADIGSVSVRYAAQKRPLQRELYEKASIYLDIFRGVSG